MAEPLKNIYTTEFLSKLSEQLFNVSPEFDKHKFVEEIFDQEWKDRELKARMRHISTMLDKHLKGSYHQKIDAISSLIKRLKINGSTKSNWEYMFLPDFVEQYGVEEYEISVKAIEEITQFTSCEFAVRPLLIKYPDKMLSRMKLWSRHRNSMVRRLSSEGCRPILPWAMGVPFLKEKPETILPILENLKNDPSESVRRSVANSLNDISKIRPELTKSLARKWMGKNKNTDWIVKHACRTLLKKGDREVMALFGFKALKKIEISDFKIHPSQIKIGDKLFFSFQVNNHDLAPGKIRLEYAVYFRKANSKLSKKIFFISENEYPGKSATIINKEQAFKILTTRKLYPGLHGLSIIVNGKEFARLDFQLHA